MSKKHKIYAFLSVFFAFFVIFPWIGAEKLEFREVFKFLIGEWTADGMILFQIRIPRVLMALLAGGALGMAGAALQVMFRNPLAEPWTLGIAGGASFGAFIARVCPFLWFSFGPMNTSQILALAGAGGALALVLSLARRPGGMGTQTLLLAGVTIGVISGGAIMVVSGFISPWKLAEFHRWLLGGLDAADWPQVATLATLVVPGLAILVWLSREYNPLGLGEEMAAGQGVDVARVRCWTAIGAGMASAADGATVFLPARWRFARRVRHPRPLGRLAPRSSRRRPHCRVGRPAFPLAPFPPVLPQITMTSRDRISFVWMWSAAA